MRFLEPFGLAGFRWTWLCILLSASGRYGLVLVGGREAFHITGSAMWTSLVMMFLLAPVLVLGPITGAMADRHTRSLLMGLSLLLAFVGCLVGALVPGSPELRLAVVVGCSVFVGVSSALFGPAWQALIPVLIGTRKLLGGGAFTRIAGQGGEFIGPAIGTPIVLALGTRVGFGYCAALYLAAALLTPWVARAEPPTERAVEPIWPRLVAGIHYVTGHRRVGGLLLLTALHCALPMGFLGLLPGLAAHRLADADAYGAIVTALGLGAIVGALVLAVLSTRSITVPTLVLCGLGSGAFQVWMGLAGTVTSALVAAFLTGAAQSTFMAASYSAVQTLTEERFRGRVASVSMMMTAGSMGLLGMAWAALADYWSESFVLAVLGALFALVMAVFLVTFPPLRSKAGLDVGSSTTVLAAGSP
jgi:MFS family permease